MKRKVYFFICRKCKQRKPVSEESKAKYGWCVACYSKVEINPT
jgi:hypothetical protein